MDQYSQQTPSEQWGTPQPQPQQPIYYYPPQQTAPAKKRGHGAAIATLVFAILETVLFTLAWFSTATGNSVLVAWLLNFSLLLQFAVLVCAIVTVARGR